MFLIILLFGCATFQFKDEAVKTGQYPQKFEKEIKVTVSMDYLLYLPEEYDVSKKSYPLILFLHGAGERGDSLELVKTHGPPKLIEQGQSFPFLIVSPQCPENQWWDIKTLNYLLNDILERYRIDKDRVYLTGLSMGGYGTWDFAIKHPDRFAAIAPICGGGEKLLAEKIKHIPAWVFHGAKDQVVPLKNSQEMVDALKQLDADVKLTVYPEAGHDSWTETYNNPELYNWFLRHRRAD